MTVTRNGQVTIPKKIREELGIEEGTELAIEREGSTITLRRKKLAWDEIEQCLPDDYEETLRELRKHDFTRFGRPKE